MVKLLVIDKNRFQGIPFDLLIEFVKNYYVVVPHILAVECLISENRYPSEKTKDPLILLNRLDRIIKGGANIGYSLSRLIEKERTRISTVDSIIDEDGTHIFRKGELSTDRDFIEREAKYCRETFEPWINLLLQLLKTFYDNAVKKGLLKNFREEAGQTSRDIRLIKWLKATDMMRKDILDKFFPEISSYVGTYWFTWQTLRLWFAWGFEWTCMRSQSGPSIENVDISNDMYDMEYVAYLSRAEGLLTRDKKLVEPLARAAFPEKDIFACIEDVPRSYRIE